MISSYDFKRRPDQTVHTLNGMLSELAVMKNSIRILSKDKHSIIVIGEMPINPDTGKPYPFGIRKFRVLGDRLVPEEEIL